MGSGAGRAGGPMRAMLLRRGRRGRCRRWSAGRAPPPGGRLRAGPTPGPDLPWGSGPEGRNDARTGMAAGLPAAARCVQRFDGSLNSAIHTTYRISLRSSSMPEPRDPLPKVFTRLKSFVSEERGGCGAFCARRPAAGRPPRGGGGAARRGNGKVIRYKVRGVGRAETRRSTL